MAVTPRQMAWQTLARWTDLSNPPLIPERDDGAWQALSGRDRNLAFDLVAGVLRRRLLLDTLIDSQLRPSGAELETSVRALLWLGAFQLLFHEGAPAYAIVDSTVELTKRTGHARAAGLVNAVLRALTRLGPILEVRCGLSLATFPRDFVYHIRLNKPVFPDPAADLVGHLAAVTSHPRELVSMLIKAHGEMNAINVLIRNNHRPAILLRADTSDFAPPADAALTRHETPGFFVAAGGWTRSVEDLVTRGELSPQDPTAAKPVRALLKQLEPGRTPLRVLDLCAGLGTKTVQIARAMPEAVVVATDIDAAKLVRLQERVIQLRLENVRVTPLEQILAEPSIGYAAVLVDAPCSNSGVMARRPQSRWRWPHLNRDALCQAQRQLLEQAAGLLEPKGGMLVYATCSIDPEENQEMVRLFVAPSGGRGTWSVRTEELTLPCAADNPEQQCDGGYYALLQASPASATANG